MKKLILLLGLLALISCNKNDSASQLKLKRANINDAKILARVESPAAKAESGSAYIMKLDATGGMTDLVIYIENQGNDIPCKVDAEKITNLGSEYVLLNWASFIYPEGFPLENTGYEYASLLIRKTTGAVYKMPNADLTVADDTDVCTDEAGNTYFLASGYGNSTGGGMVWKLSVQNEDVVLSQITTNAYAGLAVDKYGNVAVGTKHTGTDPNNIPSTKSGFHPFGYIYFAEGGVKELNIADLYMKKLFTIKGGFAAIQVEEGVISTYQIKIENKNISSLQTAACPIIEQANYSISDQDLAILCNDRFITSQQWYIDGYNNVTALLIYDGNSVSYKLEERFPENGYYNNKCYYAIDGFGNTGNGTPSIGEGKVFRYDFASLSASNTTYAISEIPPMVFTGREVLILENTCKFIKYGLRESDARSIMVQIDAETGTVSITENPDNREITTLVRIN